MVKNYNFIKKIMLFFRAGIDKFFIFSIFIYNGGNTVGWVPDISYIWFSPQFNKLRGKITKRE